MTRAFVVFVLLNLVDLLATLCLLSDPMVFYEWNPIANACCAACGAFGLCLLKSASVLLASSIAMFIASKKPKAGVALLDCASVFVGMACVYTVGIYVYGVMGKC